MSETQIAIYARLQTHMAALDRLLQLFSNLSNRQHIFDEILDIANEAIPCEAASLLLVTDEQGGMTFVAATGPVGDKIKGVKLNAGIGIAGACARDRVIIPVSDVQKESRFAREVSESLGFETRSLLAAPVLYRGELAGVLELVNKSYSDEWTRHELELVDRIARTTGTLVNLLGERS